MKSNKGIIFDLDGTLWDVTDSTLEAANEIALKYNLDVISKETIRYVFGRNIEDAAKMYFPALSLNESLKLMDEIGFLNISNLKKNGGTIYPNVVDVIINLSKRYDLFIVSNTAHKEYIEAFLLSTGLVKCFTSYVAASELGISKDAAIKKVINDFNIMEAVYVGDTRKDYEASNLAGVKFIHAKYGFDKELNTDFYINDINELDNVLEK